MGLLIRTLLIWLMALAVPAQGAATVNMALCGPTHHGTAAATAGQQPTQTAHLDDDAETALDPSAASMEPAQGVAAHETCSACASCCPAGAILNAGLAVPVPAVTSTVFCAFMATVDAFPTDGPDRPPRLVLA